jgi:hypothetical protein
MIWSPAMSIGPQAIILITSTSMLLGTFTAGAIGVPLHLIPLRPWSYETAVMAALNVVIWLAVGIWRKFHAGTPQGR